MPFLFYYFFFNSGWKKGSCIHAKLSLFPFWQCILKFDKVTYIECIKEGNKFNIKCLELFTNGTMLPVNKRRPRLRLMHS